MAVITLKDGTLGYQYPARPKAYKPTQTPLVGKRIRIPYEDRDGIIIREAPNFGVRPSDRDPSGWYWIAPVDHAGSIGAMTTRYIAASDLG